MPITVDHTRPDVRAARLQQHVSRRQLARQASVAPSALSLIERGEVTPSWLNAWRIAGTLGVQLGELINELEEEIPDARSDQID